MAELKPCPFCGGRAFPTEFTYSLDPGYVKVWSVDCVNCMSQTAEFVTEKEAIEAWNKRTDGPGEIDFDFGAED